MHKSKTRKVSCYEREIRNKRILRFINMRAQKLNRYLTKGLNKVCGGADGIAKGKRRT
jgi:hypothetical protein